MIPEKEIEEYINGFEHPEFHIPELMRTYGILQYNLALQDAANNVTASIVQSSVNEGKRAIVNKNTILNLKK